MFRMSEEDFKLFCLQTGRNPNGQLKTRSSKIPLLEPKQTLSDDIQKLLQENPKRPPKYRNQKVYVYQDGFVSLEKTDGHGDIAEHFDSVKEYRRCGELHMLQKAGKISDLNTQTTLMIQPAFQAKDGKKHKAILYRADFTYTENGEEIVEDVKGFDERTQRFLTTQTFNLKWKLLQARYPDKIFRLY